MNRKVLSTALFVILTVPFFSGAASASEKSSNALGEALSSKGQTSLAATQITKPSEALREALDKLDKSKVTVYCSCSFDGKTQASAGIQMIKMLESELAENKSASEAILSDYIHAFVGISQGSLLSAPLALGLKAADIEEINSQLESKMIVSEALANCMCCFRNTVQLASYWIDDTVVFDDDNQRLDDYYDAVTLNSTVLSLISTIAAGEEYDLKSNLAILSTSTSENFAEQVIAAIKERDNAAKKNMAKLAFDSILDAAKTATSLAIDIGGSKINASSAQKALDIMTKVDKTVEKVNKDLDNSLFKQNLTKNLAEPSADNPVLIINLDADTYSGNALKTTLTQELADNFVYLTYKTYIPSSMYPSKKLSFESVKSDIERSVETCMQNIRLDSAVSTDILTDFLTEVKLARTSEK